MAIIRKKKFIPHPLVGVGRVIGLVFKGGCVAFNALKQLALLDLDGSGVARQP